MSRFPPHTLSPERLTCWDLAANLGDINDLLMHGSKWDEVPATTAPPVQLPGLANLCDNEVFISLDGAPLLFRRTLCEISRLRVGDKFAFRISASSNLSCQMDSVECMATPGVRKDGKAVRLAVHHCTLFSPLRGWSTAAREKALFWITVRGCRALETGRHS